jgi:hypothetical protein
MNTEKSKDVSQDKYVTVSRGKDCWYIADHNGLVIARRITKKDAEDWARQRDYKINQSR